MIDRDDLYGLVAVFNTPDELLQATRKARQQGYEKMEAYSPIPIHHLAEALGFKSRVLPWLVFAGGVIGLLGGLGMQTFTSVFDYPLNTGGKPFFSWPSFIPITFECTILLAALAAVFGMLGLNGLPKPYHPIFNAPGFELASRHHFFLCIEADDPNFDREGVRQFLQSLDPERVDDVEK